ncbi:MAG: cyclic pyranopterin monophosphate synthase MoaC, partial [Promethearchaeota archaeon]
RASGKIYLSKKTIERIKNKNIKKGDPFTIAEIAGTLGVKKVPELMPLCHPIPIENIDFDFEIQGEFLKVICSVKSRAKTGVEMEALAGVNVALLNIWDVVKMYEKNEKGQYPDTQISEIKVERKVKKVNL